ncbi:MAG: SH3 domain-containing protein [Proteobacteria bacterium]|jgi:SH3-like domain-containing protein|nr:SH3 domain-containing protein [Desulfocapsa sp.]MBU3944866.1 SH3 domain-containing protein [Pseudomonadota bacterium]MCG2744903.1 SH3 domain-containing protein [Desulfobacteraceae bacterium]MBU3984754.1 SH3 domain-containing protein [Pseudomonadota bacterium]MBU4027512.1 SH3 domain-containing protein [Pseudomonadota bacterium]
MLTKIKAICLATSILFLVLSPSAFAEMRSISGDKVNLRAGPGEKYSVKWVYDDGFPVKIISRKGKWVKVQDFEKDRGWIYSSLLNKESHIIVTANKGKNKKINIRSGPGLKYDIVGQAYYGVVIKKEKEKKGWCKVKHESGLEGWIKKSLVWGF